MRTTWRGFKRMGAASTRILETKTTEIGGVSPDGEWVVVADIDSVGGEFVVRVRDRAQRKICAGVCYMKWSADGKYLYVLPISQFSKSESTQPTYIIPMPHGVERLDLPASGIDLANKEQLAGLQSIPRGNMSPGPDPQTYAFTTWHSRGICSGSRCIERPAIGHFPRPTTSRGRY